MIMTFAKCIDHEQTNSVIFIAAMGWCGGAI